MTIRHLIIHEIRRNKTKKDTTEEVKIEDKIISKIKEEENDLAKLDAELEVSLIQLFHKASLYVGQFAVNGDTNVQPVFEQKLIGAYGDSIECSDFVQLTKELAEHFKAILSKDKRINGGYLVFFEYMISNQVKLATAVINKTKGTDVDSDLNFIAREILDIEKLHLGATVNITEWLEGLSKRYIRFKKGNVDDVRDYFEDFIGCTVDKNAASQETHELKEAIETFVINELKQDQAHVDIKLAETEKFITELLNNNEDVVLEHIANKIFPNKSNEFYIYASNNHNLSNHIQISKGVL